jgi:hypothetical protein
MSGIGLMKVGRIQCSKLVNRQYPRPGQYRHKQLPSHLLISNSQTPNQALSVIASPISTASSYSLEELMSADDNAVTPAKSASTVFGRVSNGFL